MLSRTYDYPLSPHPHFLFLSSRIILLSGWCSRSAVIWREYGSLWRCENAECMSTCVDREISCREVSALHFSSHPSRDTPSPSWITRSLLFLRHLSESMSMTVSFMKDALDCLLRKREGLSLYSIRRESEGGGRWYLWYRHHHRAISYHRYTPPPQCCTRIYSSMSYIRPWARARVAWSLWICRCILSGERCRYWHE